MTTFGQELRQSRIRMGLTGPEAARIARVTQSQLSDWELDKHVPARPSLDKLVSAELITKAQRDAVLLGEAAA